MAWVLELSCVCVCVCVRATVRLVVRRGDNDDVVFVMETFCFDFAYEAMSYVSCPSCCVCKYHCEPPPPPHSCTHTCIRGNIETKLCAYDGRECIRHQMV